MIPFMRYAKSRLEKERRDFAYRIFITECLGHIVGLKTHYADMVSDKQEETRTADEIKDGIKAKLAKLGGD